MMLDRKSVHYIWRVVEYYIPQLIAHAPYLKGGGNPFFALVEATANAVCC